MFYCTPLYGQGCHIGGLKLTTEGVYMAWKSTIATNLFSFAFITSLLNTASCHAFVSIPLICIHIKDTILT